MKIQSKIKLNPLNMDKDSRVIILAGMLSGFCFWLDTSVELGVAGGVPYITVILLGFLIKRFNYFLVAAIVTTGLTLLGFALSEPGGELWKVMANRGLAIYAIWITAVFGFLICRGSMEKEYRLAKVLIQAVDLETGIRETIAYMCQLPGWQAGYFWEVQKGEERIYCSGHWYSEKFNSQAFQDFHNNTLSLTFPKGEGLPGRVWESQEPAWINHIVQDENFPRRSLAERCGFHSAFGFPVIMEGQFLGMIEIFTPNTSSISQERLEQAQHAGRLLGLFLQRKQISQALVRAQEETQSAKESIQDQRQNFFNILENLPVLFHLQASDYSIPFANKMFRQRFGDPASVPCYQVMHKRNKPCDVCSTFKVFDHKKEESSVWKATDGRTYLTVCNPYRDVDGTELVMEMAIDITEQEQAKEEVALALEKAERASEAKTEFLSRVSHELRTPMNAILGFGQLMQKMEAVSLVPEVRKSVDHILQAGNHLLKLINEMLDLSAIESGEMELCIQPVDLQPLLQEMVILCQPLAAPREIELLNQVVAKGQYVVEADEDRLRQVLFNLVSNAVNYNCDKGKVTLRAENSTTGNILIQVEDTGPGLSREELKLVFDPFNRLGNMGSGVVGTGIGLTICKQLMEMMKGEIHVSSVQGTGTCFTLELPLVGNPIPPEQDSDQDHGQGAVPANTPKVHGNSSGKKGSLCGR